MASLLSQSASRHARRVSLRLHCPATTPRPSGMGRCARQAGANLPLNRHSTPFHRTSPRSQHASPPRLPLDPARQHTHTSSPRWHTPFSYAYTHQPRGTSARPSTSPTGWPPWPRPASSRAGSPRPRPKGPSSPPAASRKSPRRYRQPAAATRMGGTSETTVKVGREGGRGVYGD